MHKNNNREWLQFLILPAAALLFLFIFSTTSSPLFPNHFGSDSAYFLMTGRQILQGGIPYIDFFDMKGPVIFFLYALGLSLHDSRLGIFLLQVIFMSASFLLIYNIARQFVSIKKSILALLLCGAVLLANLEGGGLTEELNLPFILLPLFLFCRTGNTRNCASRFPPHLSWIYGFCFGVLILTRPTNAAVLVGLGVYALVLLIKERQFAVLLKNAVSCLIGFALVLLPFTLYFLVKHALHEAIVGAFILPLFYAGESIGSKSIGVWMVTLLSLSPALWGLLVGFFARKNSNDLGWPLALSSAAVLAFFSFGFTYPHYFIMTLPVFLLALIVTEHSFSREKLRLEFPKVANLVLCFVAGGFLLFYSSLLYPTIFGVGKLIRTASSSTSVFESLLAEIPQQERDDVWGYEVESAWFASTGVSPCYRYSAFQEHFAALYPQIKEEMDEMLLTQPPKWILVGGNSETRYVILQDVLNASYRKVASANSISLYQNIAVT
jgi:hypothetical protein